MPHFERRWVYYGTSPVIKYENFVGSPWRYVQDDNSKDFKQAPKIITILINKAIKKGNCIMYIGSPKDHSNNSLEQQQSTYQYIESMHNEWLDMIARCYDPSHALFQKNGAIGVTVCHEWLYSYPNFIRDMGGNQNNEQHYTLELINNKIPYSKENCRWATVHSDRRPSLFLQLPVSNSEDLIVEPPTPNTKFPDGSFDVLEEQEEQSKTILPVVKNRCNLM